MTGLQLDELRDALTSSFTLDELRDLLRTRLNAGIEYLVAPGSLPDTVSQLLQVAERAGWTQDLVAAAYRDKPENEAIARVYQRTSAEAIRVGLSLLAGWNADAGRAAPVARFLVILESVTVNLAALASYKAMHDALHSMQHIHRLLAEGGRRSPGDEKSDEECQLYLLELELQFDGLRARAASVPNRQPEEVWVARLAVALARLRDALNTQQAEPWRAGLQMLTSLLRTQPSRINTQIVMAADRLRLGELIEAVGAIATGADATTTGSGERATSRLIAGVQGLRALQDRLAGLVEEHNQWQQLDNDLRLPPDDLLMSPGLEFLWPDAIKPALLARCGDSNERWAGALMDAAAALDAAIEREAPHDVHRAFSLLRERAQQRFYVVDAELYRLCHQLVEAVKPLGEIVRAFTASGA